MSSRYYRLLDLPTEERSELIRSDPALALALQNANYHKNWDLYRYDWQDINLEDDWETCLLVCARGAGKTATISHIVCDMVEKYGYRSILLTNVKDALVKSLNVEGPDGVIAAAQEKPDWKSSRNGGELTWPSGAIVHVASASEKNPGRGASVQAHVHDEWAHYENLDRFHKSIDDSLRWPDGGPPLRKIYATTPNYRNPKANKHLDNLRKAAKESNDVIFRRVQWTANLSITRSKQVAERESYTGSDLDWREDKLAEIILDAGDALLIKQRMIHIGDVYEDMEQYSSYVFMIDPAVTSKTTSDYTAFALVGKTHDGYLHIVHCERGKYTPQQTIAKTWEIINRYSLVPAVSVEVNQGYDYLTNTFRESGIQVRAITATRDKRERVNSVLGVWERDKVILSRQVPQYVIDELLGFTGDDETSLTDNDDCVDAIVHGQRILVRSIDNSKMVFRSG